MNMEGTKAAAGMDNCGVASVAGSPPATLSPLHAFRIQLRDKSLDRKCVEIKCEAVRIACVG